MSTTPAAGHPAHGQPGYLQIPTTDLDASITFYREVFGWQADATWAAFEAPGLIGQFLTDRAPGADAGPVLWLAVERIFQALERAAEHGGRVVERPTGDQGARWLATVADPSGNLIGLFQVLRPVRPQPLLAVADVEASSRWYQELLDLQSDHGGPEYERLLSRGELVLQLHRWDVDHHHGGIGDPALPVGNGSLVWFEVDDFDAAVARATALGATVTLGPVRNPPEADQGGPSHRELWLTDPDGHAVVIASPDGESPPTR